MTEAEWLAATDPTPMLEFLTGKVSDRKLRYFAVACCRRTKGFRLEERNQRAVEIGERIADGLASDDELRPAVELVSLSLSHQIAFASLCRVAFFAATRTGALAVDSIAEGAVRHFTNTGGRAAGENIGAIRHHAATVERGVQAIFLRDIFGNPFRPAVDLSWLTSTAVALAEGIYEERAFGHMPILADALQDAGCENEDILNHCRHPGEHVRGCWVVDLMTGRK